MGLRLLHPAHKVSIFEPKMEPGLIENSLDSRYTERVRDTLDELPDCFTITDPHISGHPIVFASNGFLKMVGYSRDEVVGRNARIFQGPATDRRMVMEIREAVREGRGVQLSLLNYRKDETPFSMLFEMRPVFSEEDGRVVNFVGVQVPILRKRLNGMNSCEDVFVRCCRREVCFELKPLSAPSNVEKINELCAASEVEKTKANSAVDNILSILTHHSKLTARPVCRNRLRLTGNERLVSSLNTSLARIKQSFVLTDAFLPDTPIVYASEAFLKLSGYARHEVLGKNCRFLTGIDTDSTTRFKIRESIRSQQACTVRILNYRKDKTSFWNLLHISPVRNASGKVAFFVGIQTWDDNNDMETHRLRPEVRQLSVVGAVKVAVRGLSMGASTS